MSAGKSPFHVGINVLLISVFEDTTGLYFCEFQKSHKYKVMLKAHLKQ